MSETAPKRGGRRPGGLPLSPPTRRRLLAELLTRADQGDTAAAESLIRLSLEARRSPASDTQIEAQNG
jgi:hypothetical protein